MFGVGGVGVVRVALVVEIVEQGGEAPELFVVAEFAGVGANAGFHGEHVFAEGFGLRVFADELPGFVAGGEGWGVGHGRWKYSRELMAELMAELSWRAVYVMAV